MDCFHIKQVTLEIAKFYSKIGVYNSSLYRTLPEIVNKRDITKKEILIKKGWINNDYHTVATYTAYDFHYVPDVVLTEFINGISNLLADCDCHEENKNQQMTNKKRLVFDVGNAIINKQEK